MVELPQQFRVGLPARVGVPVLAVRLGRGLHGLGEAAFALGRVLPGAQQLVELRPQRLGVPLRRRVGPALLVHRHRAVRSLHRAPTPKPASESLAPTVGHLRSGIRRECYGGESARFRTGAGPVPANRSATAQTPVAVSRKAVAPRNRAAS